MAKLSLKLERPHHKKDKTKKNEILLMLLNCSSSLRQKTSNYAMMTPISSLTLSDNGTIKRKAKIVWISFRSDEVSGFLVTIIKFVPLASGVAAVCFSKYCHYFSSTFFFILCHFSFYAPTSLHSGKISFFLHKIAESIRRNLPMT